MRIPVVACLVLASLAAALPAGAQDAAPGPLRVLDDPTGDEDVTVATQHTGQSRWSGSDLVSLDVDEDDNALILVLSVRDLVVGNNAPIADGIDYEIRFTARDAPYIIQMFFTGEDAADNVAAYWCQPDDFFARCFEELPAVADASADTFTITVDHDLLVASDGARLLKGDLVRDFAATAQAQGAAIAEGESSGTVSSEDAMPDQGVGTVAWTIQQGITQVGHLVLGAATPVRVSNGEATTFLFKVQLRNLLDRRDTAKMAASGFPPEWVVTFPQEEVRVEGGETVDVAVLVTTPFNHIHGDYKAFNVTATSISDPLAVGVVELAVRYTRVPQPSGHHPDLYLHSDGGWLYVNTLEEEELPADEQPATRSSSSCSSSGGTYSGSSETVALIPELAIGLDVDLAQTGLARIVVTTDLPLLGGHSIGGWFIAWTGDDRPSPCLSQVDKDAIMVVEKSAPLQMDAQSQAVLELPIRGLPLGDYMQYTPDLHMMFILAVFDEGGQDLGTPTVQPGSTFHLPLAEYHDPVDEYFSTLSGIELEATTDQQRFVNPGETVVFRVDAQNLGIKSDTFDLEMTGTHTEWARILGDTKVTIPAGSIRELAVAVAVPGDVSAGEMADVTLHAVKADDDNVRSLIRLLATVDTAQDYPDEAGDVPAIDDDLSGKESPGLAPLALGLGLLGLAVVQRRRR